MDINTITAFIQTVGFPASMCLVLLYYLQDTTKRNKAEVDTLRDAINNNTLVLQKIIDKIEMEAEKRNNE